MATSNNNPTSYDPLVHEKKINHFGSFHLDAYETGFFDPQMDFDSLDMMISESMENQIDLKDIKNEQNHSEIQISSNLKSIDEQVLSQKMSQLSTNKVNEKEWSMNYITEKIEKISNNLARRNESFHRMIDQVVSIIKRPISKKNKEELHRMILLQFKIRLIQGYQNLWTSYLKSGTGQLIMSTEPDAIYSTNLSIWPKEIKQLVRSTTKDLRNVEQICLNFVNDHLYQLNHRYKQYQTELHMKINNVDYVSSAVQQLMESYIERNSSKLQKGIHHETELVQFDYHIQALKITYHQHNPNLYQMELMKTLCRAKYLQETSEQEYKLLQQQIAYYSLPNQSFESSPTSHCLSIDSIETSKIRHSLFQQYKNIAEQSRVKMFNLDMKTAEEEKNQYKENYDAEEKKMLMDQRTVSENEKISSIMINLIEQRCIKISDRIQFIYQYKTQSIDSQSSYS